MATFFLLLLKLVLIAAYDRYPHKKEVLLERFKFEDYYFVFYAKTANWAEAHTICQVANSRLAVVDTPERARFLARTLSQTKSSFEDVWIGGHFSKDSWIWVSTKKKIAPPAGDFPPWLRYPTIRGKNCLSLDRRNHWDPLFVELKCNLYRPFICEESVSGSIDKSPEIGTETTINDHDYFLYHGRLTWDEALAFCKQSGTQLAVVSDVQTAQRLAKLMKRARPPFENVWIGARNDISGWMWVPTQEQLSNETGLDGYPPWRFESPADDLKSCVMLDRHLCSSSLHMHSYRHHHCEEGVFIEESCSLKKEFVCESTSKKIKDPEKDTLVTVDQVTYIFFEDRLTWDDALHTCEEMDMTLAAPETDRQLQTIVNYMGDMQRELYHVWLGGRWRTDKWFWVNNCSIPVPNGNQTFPPWCKSMPIHETNEDCLNLDRDAHSAPLVYGLNCSMKQAFACQIKEQDYIVPPVEKDGKFILHKHNLSFSEADWDCRLNHTNLAIANSSEIAQNIALILPRNVPVWVGAKRIDGVWRWLRTGEIIPDIKTGSYPPWEDAYSSLDEHVCLAMKSGYREQPSFVERPCKEKLFYLSQKDTVGLPYPSLILEFNGILYYFYERGASWATAMDICRSGNLHLINVGNLDLAKFLLDAMADNTPLWTSGKQISEGSWTWITSGQKLPNSINHNYPPWPNKSIPKDKEKSCLQLNRADDVSMFEAEDCLQNRSFVCVDKIVITNETEVQIDNLTISLLEIITSIENAKKSCSADGKEVIDFTKISQDQLIKFFKLEGVKSFWVDVIYNGTNWVHTGSKKVFVTDIPFPEKNNRSSSDSRNCLTLQLTTGDLLILEPSYCNDFSRMLCVTNIQEEMEQVQLELQLNDTVKFIAFSKTTVYNRSVEACNDLGGDVVQGLLLNKSIEFFKNLSSTYKSFWTSAKYENNQWIWSDGKPVDKEFIPESPTLTFSNKTYKTEKHCSVFNRRLDHLEASSCSDKHGVVCEKVDLKCEPKNSSTESLIWPEKCTKGPVSGGTVCKVECKDQSSLLGPELHVCSKGKWSFEYDVKCKSNKEFADVLHSMQKRIQKERVKSFLLFILDSGLPPTTFRATVQWVKNLVNTIPLSSRRRVSLQLYSRKSKIFNILENNNCYFIKTCNEIEEQYKISKTSPNYYNALLTAKREIDEISSSSNYVFFFAMRPDVGSMNKTILVDQMKRKGVTFVVISVGDDVNRNLLEQMASVKYDILQLFLFKTLRNLTDASFALRRKSNVKLHDCSSRGGIYG